MSEVELPQHADAPDDGAGKHRTCPPKASEPLWRDALGDRLRGVRHERGETLTDVARRAGVSPQYLSEVERGLKEPSSEMIAAIGGALDLTLVDLTLSVAEGLIARTPQPARSTQRTAFVLAA